MSQINLTIFDEGTAKVYNITTTHGPTTTTIAQVKQLIHEQTNHAVRYMRLSFEGKQLSNDSATLSSLNISDHDVIQYSLSSTPIITPPQNQQNSSQNSTFSSNFSQNQQRPPTQSAFGTWGAYDFEQPSHQTPQTPQSHQTAQQQLSSIDFTKFSATQFIELCHQSPPLMHQLSQLSPPLYQAIQQRNDTLVDRYLEPLREQQRERHLMMRLEQNPFDIEAQQQLEEMIHQRNIEENMRFAYEHNPESFATVFMLYIESEVNGVALKAFVDSGAQMSVMGRSCAQKCNLMRLLDKRYHGVATGVGSAKILGRIHLTQLKIGHSFFNLTITVLDQDDMEFLIGLDMLRRWQACIDLKRNVLVVGDEQVRFLSEHELPQKAKLQPPDSPTPTGASSSSSSGVPATTDGARPTSPFSLGGTSSSSQAVPPPSSPSASALLQRPPVSPSPTVQPQQQQQQQQPPRPQVTSSTQQAQLDILQQFLRSRPQAAAQTQVPQQQPQQQAMPQQQVTVSESAIEQLMGMGFDREACVNALRRTRGNVEAALNLLLG